MMRQQWFRQTGEPNFQQHLMVLRGKPDLRFLQIGAFEGDASEWLLEHILVGDNCELHDIDPWGNSQHYADLNQLGDIEWSDIYRNYLSRMEPYVGRVLPFRMTSNEFFQECDVGDDNYQFIYIDGAHDSVSVLEDAVNAYRRLTTPGILAFDDYTWNASDNDPLNAPAMAINAIRLLYTGRLITLLMNTQVWMLKVA